MRVSLKSLRQRVQLLAGLMIALSASTVQGSVTFGESSAIPFNTQLPLRFADSNALDVDTTILVYEHWVAASSLPAGQQGLLATPLNDGVPNLLKYAFNLPGNSASVPLLTAQNTEGLPRPYVLGNRLAIETLRRKDVRLTYKAKFTPNLTSWQDVLVPEQVTSVNAVWERAVYLSPVEVSGNTRWLGVIEVTYSQE